MCAPQVGGELLLPPTYLLWMYALTQSPEGLAAKVFRWAPFRHLGKISFCLYVLHFPLLHYYSWARAAIDGRDYWRSSRHLEPWDIATAFLLIFIVSTAAYGTPMEPRHPTPHRAHPAL